MERTRLLVTAALAALALIAPVTSSPAVAGAPVLGPNHVTMGDRVPWGKVGHGWYLTLLNQGPHGEFGIDADHQLLDLVDPLGGRYQLAKTAVGKDGSGYRSLEDWSVDGRTALELVATRSTPRAVLYDLPAGTHRSIPLTKHVSGVALGPGGSIYETWYGGNGGQPLARRDADGATTVLRRHTDGEPLTTPSVRRLVVGTNDVHDHRLLVLGSHGRLIRSVDGSAGHWISADHGKNSADLGDLDARRLNGTTYLEAAGPCGVVFLARQHRNGAATKVHVPGATENVYLLGTRKDRLVLQMGITCDSGTSRDAITHFDPKTGHNRIVALLPENEEYGAILGLAERRVPFV